MICEIKPRFDDVELMMVLDGEADPEVMMHVSQCPQCSQRAAQLEGSQHELASQLFRATCPTSLELGEYYLEMLPKAAAAAVKQHLGTCPFCEQELARLSLYMDQPDPFLQPDRLASVRRRVDILVAKLTSSPAGDGRLGGPAFAPALAGLRGAADGPLTYEAGGVQVMLDVQDDATQPGRKVIFGLIMGLESFEGVEVSLWQDGRRLASAAVDDIGNFIAGDLLPGSYDLILTGGPAEIHIQDVELAE